MNASLGVDGPPFARIVAGEWFATRAMAAPPPFLVGHWTAGEGDPSRVFDVLVARDLSVHFVGDHDGTLQQMAPVTGRCAHAGTLGNVGLGVEMINRGLPRKDGTAERPLVETRIHGRKVKVVSFTDAQLASWVALAEWGAAKFGWPRQVPNTDRVLTPAEIKRWRGALEHMHLTAKKIDAGGLLTGALVKAGWKAVTP